MATISEALALADAHQGAGNLAYAEQVLQAVLKVAPSDARALHLMGVVRLRCGDNAGALPWLERAVAVEPTHTIYQCNYGLALSGVGRTEEAVAAYRRSLTLNPDYPESNNNLGVIIRERGDPEEALVYYERALRLRPDYADAHNNLAIALFDLGRYEKAEGHFRRAISLKPGVAEMFNNLGATLRELGRDEDALACYRQSLALKPHSPATINNLGIIEQQELHLEKASAYYRKALAVEPKFVSAFENMSGILQELGRFEEARKALDEALSIEPRPRFRYKRALIVPVFVQSVEHLRLERQRLENEIDAMLADGIRVDPLKLQLQANFYLAYQGCNDRALLEKLGRICSEGCEDFTGKRPPPVREDGRIRIGFVSGLFRNHTIGWYWKDNVAALDRSRFHVTVLSLKGGDDEVSLVFRQAAERFVQLPRNLVEARQRVADLGLDVLYYTDIGMEPAAFALATSRMAPVQCVTWGHPLTTGLKTIDYFVSSELLEADGAEDHYSERLVRLKSMGLYLSPPEATPSTKTRADFGLPEGRRLYGCVQSPFKIHPDDDANFAEILRRDPEGDLVLLRGTYPSWHELLQKRFATTIPGAAGRIHYLERLSTEDFLRVDQLVDVLLDPIHFSGGKTSYEAFSLGIPVVTMPSPYLRGRITNGLYRILGVTDAIAHTPEQYVEIALRLARDREHRADVSRRIQAASGRLFGDRSALAEQEDFLAAAVAAARQDKKV